MKKEITFNERVGLAAVLIIVFSVGIWCGGHELTCEPYNDEDCVSMELCKESARKVIQDSIADMDVQYQETGIYQVGVEYLKSCDYYYDTADCMITIVDKSTALRLYEDSEGIFNGFEYDGLSIAYISGNHLTNDSKYIIVLFNPKN